MFGFFRFRALSSLWLEKSFWFTASPSQAWIYPHKSTWLARSGSLYTGPVILL
jgi:hypothetical protein